MEPASSSVKGGGGGGKPSARKLGASLWEAQELFPASRPRMSVGRSRPKPRQHHLSDASEPNSPLQIQSAGRLMRHLGAPFDQRQEVAGKASVYLQPVSPASYNSSVEVSCLDQAISRSLDLKARLGESGFSIKTSAELIKVLNRIWSLEEQLASSLSLVKTLKAELHHAHSRIQKLMEEQESYRCEMDDLMKRVSEDRVNRKNRERDRIKAAVESAKNELEEEKKLRRRSESLHRQLSKELADVNSAFNKALNDLDGERRARGLLSELCDELAKGIQEYEQEIWNQKQKFGRDFSHRFDQSLRHISKVWIDTQLDMKIAAGSGDEAEENKILERLRVEITEFLQARRSYSLRNNDTCREGEKDRGLRRHSLESVHLNGAVGAPQDAEEDDDSVVSDLHCLEFNVDTKDNGGQALLKENHEGDMSWLKGKGKATFRNEMLKYPERADGHDVCDLKRNRTECCDGNKMHHVNSSRDSISCTGTGQCEVHTANCHTDSCNHVLKSSHVTSTGKNNASGSGDSCCLDAPVVQWNYRNMSSDLEISKGSSNLRRTIKENSLKEKLLEARLEGKNARLRALKGSMGSLQQ